MGSIDMTKDGKTEYFNLVNFSHETRSPLNAILGMNEMILRECKDVNILKYAQSIEAAALHLLSLVDEVLSGSSDDKVYGTGNIILSLRSMFAKSAGAKDITLDINASDNVPDRLIGDITKIRQICINLLSNAIKYTDRGRITFHMSSEDQDDDTVLLKISVRDTGRGISEKGLKALFSEHQRVDDDFNKDIEGTGLGLSIAKHLIEEMDGTLAVESVFGRGAMFTAEFPQKKAVKPQREEVSFNADGIKILAVDDLDMNLTVIKGFLKDTGVKIDTARDARECLKNILFNGYNLILMDDKMPEVSGSELLAELKEKELLSDFTKVIAMTGNGAKGDRERYLSKGFDDYIKKPVDRDELIDLLIKYLPAEKVTVKKKENTETVQGLPRWLFDNGYIDISSGLKMCRTPEIYLKTLENFKEQAEAHIVSLKTAYATGDEKTVSREIHSVKSMASLIGCGKLSSLAKSLEDEPRRVDALLSLYSAVAGSLSRLGKGEDGPVRREVEEDAIPLLFNHLSDYVDDFNDEAVGSMLRALSKYSFPDGVKEIFEDLRKAHKNADWIKMKDILKKYQTGG